MKIANPLLGNNDPVLKKEVLSVREHCGLENRTRTESAEADDNLIQFLAKFAVIDINVSG